MAKTYKKIVDDTKKKEIESPAHKKRREIEDRLRDIKSYDPKFFEEDDYEDIETFEPVKRKR